jgi:hypothetical protein
MDIGLLATFAGLTVAGLAGVLGVWMERDRSAPPKWAWVFSGLILIATGVEMSHSVVAAAEDSATDEAMARVLGNLTVISAKSDDPTLRSFVSSELAAQARNNPDVLEKAAENAGVDTDSLKRRAAVGRRMAAGLPARRPGARGKAGKAGGKAKSRGKAGKSKGKSGGKAGAKAGGKSGGKAGTTAKSGGKAGGSDTTTSRSKSSGSTAGSSGGSKSKGKGR